MVKKFFVILGIIGILFASIPLPVFAGDDDYCGNSKLLPLAAHGTQLAER